MASLEETHSLLGNAANVNPNSADTSSSGDETDRRAAQPMWKRVLTSIWAKLALIAVLAVLVGILLWKFPWAKIPALLDYMRAHPARTVPPFFILNALAVILFLPGAAFQMVGGAVYGIWAGWILSFLGTSCGVLGAFLLGRYLFKEQLSGWIISKFPHYGVIEAAIFKEDGWKLVWLLRMTPGLPDSLLNYATGLTSCSFSLFAAASCTSLLFYSFLYAWVGHASRDIIATIRGGEVGNAKMRLGLTIASVVLGCFTLVYLIIVMRRALNKVLKEAEVAGASPDEALLPDGISVTGSVSHTALNMGPAGDLGGGMGGVGGAGAAVGNKPASPVEVAMGSMDGHGHTKPGRPSEVV